MDRQNTQFQDDVLPDVEPQEVPDEIDIEADGPTQNVSASEPEHEEPSKPKPRRDAKSRINELTREKYEAIEQAKYLAQRQQELQLEVERLRRITDMTTTASMAQQETAANERLQRAKERKAAAIESGDIASQVDADIQIASAVSDVQKLQYDKSYRDIQAQVEKENYETEQQYYQQQQYLPPEVANKHIAERWCSDNDWFVKGSPNYNPRLAQEVDRLCDSLDASLYRNGQQDKILSEEYFQYINQQIPYLQQRYANTQGVPAMNNTREVVSPVRNSNSGQYQQKQRVTLSSDEKYQIRMLGVKPELYMKHKLSDMARQKARREGGY